MIFVGGFMHKGDIWKRGTLTLNSCAMGILVYGGVYFSMDPLVAVIGARNIYKS